MSIIRDKKNKWKFWTVLSCDLNKTICNLGFVGAVLVTCVLCFTALAYTDATTGRSYSVFEALFRVSQKLIQTEPDFSNVKLFAHAFSGYITMFLPIIAAFPFLVSFCAERNSGLMRFTITRTGIFRYCASKFAAAVLSGGLAALLGVTLYGIIVWIRFPNLSSYQLPADQLSFFLPAGVMATILRTLLASFLCGAVTTILAVFLGSFCRNPYLIACVPFLFSYIWQTALDRIAAQGLEQMDYGIYDRIAPFYPYGLADIVSWTQWDNRVIATLVFNGIYLMVGMTGFFVIMKCRVDKGV